MADDNLLSNGLGSENHVTYSHPRGRIYRSASEEPTIRWKEKDFLSAIIRINVIKRSSPKIFINEIDHNSNRDIIDNSRGSEPASPQILPRIQVCRPETTLDINSDVELKRTLKLSGAKMLHQLRLETKVSRVLESTRSKFKMDLIEAFAKNDDYLTTQSVREYSRKWFYWAFYLAKNLKAAKVQKIISSIETSYEEIIEQDLKFLKCIYKNLAVIKRCDILKLKAAVPTLCKLCNETIKLQDMANHSFKCFERKSIHKELDKVNKMIVRLRTTMNKIKNQLRKLVLF